MSMYGATLSVGFFTLVSRASGFVRDTVLAWWLGTGLIADAFVVAQRLPNHFRAIFGEGAFNAAFVPSYSLALETEGKAAAQILAGRLASLLLLALGAFSVAAIAFMPQVVSLLAPGFSAEPEKFDLAVSLTRITFPYLLFVTLVTLTSGVLNANERFAAAAAAPILLNVSIIAALSITFVFPDAGHAAAWGVAAAGVLELALVVAAAERAGCLFRLKRIVFDRDMRHFFGRLGPAVVGSAGVQIAMFADTVIASLLPTGAVSAIYYADRIYQLPVGVIGIAAGTVLLPTMSRRLAAGDEAGALFAQNRAIGFTLALSAPFFVAFLLIPDLVMRGLFLRGAFTDGSAAAAGAVLLAYGLGLPAVVLIRSIVATFYARQDTTTPLIASFSAIAVNVALKIALFRGLGAPGLALATAIGAIVNVGLLLFLARRRALIQADAVLWKTIAATLIATALLAGFTLAADGAIGAWCASFGSWRHVAHLAVLGSLGAALYAMVLIGGFRALRVPFRRG